MANAAQYPLPRERNAILALLIILSAAAWAIVIQQTGAMGGMSGDMADMPGMSATTGASNMTGMGGMSSSGGMAGTGATASNALTMGMSAPLFLTIWIVMMVAMMFPSAAPMILMFARVAHGKQAQAQPFVPTWVFVAGYLAVWTAFGVVAYLAALTVTALAEGVPFLMQNAPRIGGALLVFAGVYQLTPLKTACLSKCRSPFYVIATSWREGYGGALRMGVEEGAYCLGCCWMLMLALFPLGVMNVAVMAIITILVFAEKVWWFGPQTARAAAAALIVYGLVVMAVPAALLTTMSA